MVLQKQAHQVLESPMMRRCGVCIGFCWPLPLLKERPSAEPAGSRVAPACGKRTKLILSHQKRHWWFWCECEVYPHGTTCLNTWSSAGSVVYGHRGPFGILGTLKVILVSGSQCGTLCLLISSYYLKALASENRAASAAMCPSVIMVG